MEVLFVQLFQLFRNHVEGFRHNGIQHHVGFRTALARTGSAELELVARKGKGAGTVAVRSIAGQRRQHVRPNPHGTRLLAGLGNPLFQLLDHVHQLVTQIHGHDGRGSLVGTQAVVIARARHRHAQQIGVGIHRIDNRAQGGKEHGILMRVLTRIQQVSVTVGNAPVVVLARTVHAGKGLLVQQAHQTVTVRHLAQHFHNLHVVVAGQVHFFKNGSQFKLGRGHLVMAGLGRNSQLPQFLFHIVHKVQDAGGNATEIVVIHLLVLSRSRPKDSAARLVQVRPLQVKTLVNQKVFLLGTQGHRGLLGACLEAGHEPPGRLGKGLQTAEQRSLLVQGLAGIAAEGRGNAEGGTVAVTLDKGGASGVPGRIATGLESGTESAAGETGSVRFAHNQVLAAKGHNGLAVFKFQEGIVLFGGGTRQGLEPVGKVGSATIQSPLLHGVSHFACNACVQGNALVDGGQQLFAALLGEVVAHGLGVEHVLTEIIHVHRGRGQNGAGGGGGDVVNGVLAVIVHNCTLFFCL